MDAFKQEVERNLATKYEDYYDEPAPERPYFESFEPRKEIGVPLHYAEQEVQIIGTTWEFEYECQTRPMYRLMRMAYSAGLGELNTTGFGFVNPD
jgi:CRISPR-associated endoribonuclease Cas6